VAGLPLAAEAHEHRQADEFRACPPAWRQRDQAGFSFFELLAMVYGADLT
jgi:hypothetical protein